MRRIASSGALSLLIYIAAFALILDRPLTSGALRVRIEATLAHARTANSPKLVILAGSNGPYSHRCETIGPIIGRPCISGGVAVGVGLDYLFSRWKPALHSGDIVYLPLEEAQYVRSRAATGAGPDAAIMVRHDRATLWSLPRDRQLAALFSNDLRSAVMSVLESILAHSGFRDPRPPENLYGDHVGHTAVIAKLNAGVLASIVPAHPTATQIRDGYGTALVGTFLLWTRQAGIRVIGGLPTGFTDSPIPDASIAAITALYRDHGAEMLVLPNHSRYPRSAFFDTADHLNETAQIAHSILVGQALTAIAATPAPSR